MSDLDQKILIIGAGPAGLSAAMFLRKRGYRDLTVLEKEPVVGGKCHSLRYGGRAYDLGANLTTPRYTTIRPLAAQLGLTPRQIQERRIVNLGPDQLRSLSDAGLLERLVVRAGAQLYVTSRSFTGIDKDGYRKLPEGVRRPFAEWLDRHGLSRFREVFANLFVAYGYGLMDDLPAAYALKFFDPVHLAAAVDVMLGEEVATTTDFEEGFQELWERVDRRFELATKRSANVTSVTRDAGGVHVVYEHEGRVHHEDHDRLVLACPLDAALGFLDASPDEDRLFRQIKTFDYYVTAAILDGAPDLATYVAPYARAFVPGQPTVYYPPVDDDPNRVFLFYAYGAPGIGAEAARANIRTLMDHPRIEGDLREILTTQHWRYFPHVDSDAMLDGWHDQVEDLQGQRRTVYVGEVLSFTLVELVARYSKRIVTRHF